MTNLERADPAPPTAFAVLAATFAALAAALLLLWSVASFESLESPPVPLPALAPAPAPAAAVDGERASDSVFALDAPWMKQDGTSTRLRELGGAPLVIAMVYTGCRATCPLTISDMRAIEEKLSPAARARVRFVLVTFDPLRDTPARMTALARERSLDLTRWTLLTGDDDETRELAAVLGVKYRRIEGGDFVHSSVITVLDGGGTIRSQVGLREDPLVSARVLEALLTR